MADLKSELTLQAVLAAAPSMTRAQANHISADATTARSFAYGSANTVLVRDIEDPAAVLMCNRHSAAVTVARIAPNGLLVASGDKDGNLVVWANRPDTAEKYRSKLLSGAVRDISWSDDSERLAVVGEGRGGDFASVITVSGSSIGEITGHTQNIVTCDFRKIRPFKLFTGAADTKVGFFEGPPFKFTHSVPSTFKNAVTCVRVSPDHEAVACVSGGNEIVLLAATTGKQTKAIPTDHQGTIYGVAWAANSKRVATASADKSVKVYDVDSGALLSTVSFGKAVSSMQQSIFFSAIGLVSVSLNGTINVLGEDNGSVQRQWLGHQKPVIALYFDQRANAILSVGSDGAILRWPGGAPGSAQSIHIDGDGINCVAYVADKQAYVAVAGTDLVVFDGTSTAATVLCKDANHAAGIAAVGGSAQHYVLLYKNAFAVFDAKGKKVYEEKIPQFDGCSIASSGNRVALGGDKAVRVYAVDGTTGKADLTGTFQQHTVNVTAIAFSPDGEAIASGDSGKSVFVWSASDPSKILYDSMTYHTLRVSTLVFASPTRLISGSVDSSVIVWELDQKKRRTQDYAHRGGVTVVALGADGEVISAGGDLCIRRWSVVSS